MRVIENKVKDRNEKIVECPDCKSIFGYVYSDVRVGSEAYYVTCPCCNKNNWVYNLREK